MNNLEIGRRLTELRENKGFKSEKVAKYLNLDINKFQQIEDNPKELDLVTLNRLCDVYDVSKEYVLLGKGEIHKPQKIAFRSEGFDLEVYAKMNGLKRYLRVLKNID